MKDRTIVIVAIIALTLLELAALYRGINGTLLRWMIIAISGLAGLVIPTPNKIKEMIQNVG